MRAAIRCDAVGIETERGQLRTTYLRPVGECDTWFCVTNVPFGLGSEASARPLMEANDAGVAFLTGWLTPRSFDSRWPLFTNGEWPAF